MFGRRSKAGTGEAAGGPDPDALQHGGQGQHAIKKPRKAGGRRKIKATATAAAAAAAVAATGSGSAEAHTKSRGGNTAGVGRSRCNSKGRAPGDGGVGNGKGGGGGGDGSGGGGAAHVYKSPAYAAGAQRPKDTVRRQSGSQMKKLCSFEDCTLLAQRFGRCK